MLARYTRPEMGAIWERERYFEAQLRVEIAVCDAWAETGAIPKEDAEKIHKATYSLERIDEIEKTTDHETDAFVAAVAETLGKEARWFHLGLTSSDVLDTGLSLQLVGAADQLLARLRRLEEAVTALAMNHRDTLTIGRTHGMHAEPTTFGFKVLVWVDEVRRQIVRLEQAREQIAVGKISGSVGTHANVPPQVEEIACRKLGLRHANVSNQVLQRDRHAHFMSTLALIAGSLEKFATELRSLQRTEIGETEEPFEAGRHGSSSMPHKRNPARCERVCGIARVVRANAVAAFENMALWHERDISHSSAERIILGDSCIALDYMLWLFTRVVEGLRVDTRRMLENMDATKGLIYSQGVMLALVEHGLSRQEAYELVYAHSMKAREEGIPLKDILLADRRVSAKLSKEEMEALFDPTRHLKWIGDAYGRLGLGGLDSEEN